MPACSRTSIAAKPARHLRKTALTNPVAERFGLFRQLDGLVHNGISRDAFEKTDLVYAQAKGGDDFGVEVLKGLAGKSLDLEIKCPSPAENTHHHLGRQPPVSFFQLRDGPPLEALDGEPTSAIDAAQDVVGCLSGR